MSIKIKVLAVALSTIMLTSSVSIASTVSDDMLEISPEINIENTVVPMNYSEPSVDKKKLASFVERLYTVCLDREPDMNGLNSWVEMLANREQTGVSAAYGFIFSNEFQSKNCSNEQYVQYMYDAFFGRKADAAGLNTWVGLLNSGTSREAVFAGFANSEEFSLLCANYGVVRGNYFEQYDWQQTAKVNLFVDRLYTLVLERDCDEDGMAYWTEALLSHEWTGISVANGFVFSEEFTNRRLCNNCLVKVLYQAFMGREADPAGLAMWADYLNKGNSIELTLEGFLYSQEFKNICDSYGIDVGNNRYREDQHYGLGMVCANCAPSVVGFDVNKYADIYWSEMMEADTREALGDVLWSFPMYDNIFYRPHAVTLIFEFDDSIPVVPKCYYVLTRDGVEIDRSEPEELFFYFDRYIYDSAYANSDYSPVTPGVYNYTVYTDKGEFVYSKTCKVLKSDSEYYYMLWT